MTKRCPNCKLTSPSDALRCDCGYDFTTGEIPAPGLRQKRAKRLRIAKRLLLFVWFIIGPFFCYALANFLWPTEMFFGYSDPGRVSRYIIGAALAAIPVFVIAIPLWLRFVVFAIYGSFVFYALPLVLVTLACYVSGNCL